MKSFLKFLSLYVFYYNSLFLHLNLFLIFLSITPFPPPVSYFLISLLLFLSFSPFLFLYPNSSPHTTPLCFFCHFIPVSSPSYLYLLLLSFLCFLSLSAV